MYRLASTFCPTTASARSGGSRLALLPDGRSRAQGVDGQIYVGEPQHRFDLSTWFRYLINVKVISIVDNTLLSTSDGDPNLLSKASDAALLRAAIDAWREEYKELSELWRHLDTKAQGAIVLSGILLAAFGTFVTKHSAPFTVADKVLSIIEVTLIAITIGMYAAALSLRESVLPPSSGSLQSIIDDLLGAEISERVTRLDDMAGEEIALWKSCNLSVRSAIESKTSWLWRGQIFACLAIACLAILAVILILE